MTDQDVDRSCMERLRTGDMKAMEELYDRHAPMLYALALRIVRQVHDAEEVLQDTFVQAWRRADSWDPARGTVAAWLITLTRSRSIDRLRSQASRERAESTLALLDPPAMKNDPESRTARRQQEAHLAAALAGLGPKHREVLELAYFGGLSQSEIATRVGAPLGTVKSWTRQALLHLREVVPQEESR